VKFLKHLVVHYTIPFNRFVANFTSHLIYTLLIVLVAVNPSDVPGQTEIDWYDYLTVLYTLAYLLADAQANRVKLLHAIEIYNQDELLTFPPSS
jgi:hypothetical protein